jgi:hypothetical protein
LGFIFSYFWVKIQPKLRASQSDSLRKMSRGKSKLWPHHAKLGQIMPFRYANRREKGSHSFLRFLMYFTGSKRGRLIVIDKRVSKNT